MLARFFGLVAACAWLSGCATIVEGTSQNILVAVNPSNTECEATRKGEVLGHTGLKNGVMLRVDKSRNDIVLTCSAPGYQTATLKVESSLTAAGTASILAIDLGVTDYATGALNKYPDTVAVTLTPQPLASSSSVGGAGK